MEWHVANPSYSCSALFESASHLHINGGIHGSIHGGIQCISERCDHTDHI